MPDLDQIIDEPSVPERVVLDGVLVEQNGELWARVSGQTALYGPVLDGTDGRAEAGVRCALLVTSDVWVVGVL